MLNLRYTLLLLAAVSLPVVAPRAVAQLSYSSGQSVSPAFEGWEPNPDGSYDIFFGYMNDNWEEQLDVPVGPDNNISPGLPDQGQPTHFYPRRNRFVFRVRVPKDWGSNKEVVWTLTTHGKTIKAYGTLKLDYQVDNVVMMSETGALGAGASTPEIRANKPPVIEIDGDASRTVKVGQPLELKTNVTDDGVPKPRPRRTGLLDPAEACENEGYAAAAAIFGHRRECDRPMGRAANLPRGRRTCTHHAGATRHVGRHTYGRKFAVGSLVDASRSASAE